MRTRPKSILETETPNEEDLKGVHRASATSPVEPGMKLDDSHFCKSNREDK